MLEKFIVLPNAFEPLVAHSGQAFYV